MPPNTNTKILQHIKATCCSDENKDAEDKSSTVKPKLEIVWRNVFIFICLHLVALYGFYLYFCKVLWLTFFYAYFLTFVSGLGVTAGAHRLWTHRSYKANTPLQIFLVILNCMALQDSVIHWARDHRMHHKYSETDADPYNSRRGFFFCHIGWLLVRKHPEVIAKGKTMDMSDLTSNPILMFQKRYYVILSPIICFVIPAYIATLWGESPWNAFFTCSIVRYVAALHGTWAVNSFAHMCGNKPYDKNIYPVENKIVSWFAYGEGFHNFHHTFPWDYKTGELGGHCLNLSTVFIDAMAAIGWAYDLKSVSDDLVQKRIERTGDGSHETEKL